MPPPPCQRCGRIHAGACPDGSSSDEGTTQLATDDASIATAEPGAAAPRPPSGIELRPRAVAAQGSPAQFDYLTGEVVGQGGMGLVRRGLQTSLGRPVALKTLRLERTTNPAAWSRFLIEAAVTAHLDHPGIVPVYDLGVDGEGRPFYVMPLVEGRPWSDSIGTVPLAYDLEVLLAVAEAVAYAHSKGVVHRDLKPSNILLGPFGQVLVVDWGLALAVAPGGPAPPPGPGGAGGGTPAWMAPESARGDWRRIGRATDVYLLGGLLHRILAGVPPHGGADARAQVAAAAANAIQGRAEGPLAALAARAMAEDPAQRFADAAEFRTALAEWQDHHESIALARAAGEELARARSAGGYTAAARACSGAARGFAAAMRLWPGNAVAQVSLAAARLAWARLALDQGDLDLAESLLDRRCDGHGAVLDRVLAARREERQHRRRSRLLRRGLAAAAVLLAVLAGGWGWLRWDQQRRLDLAEVAAAADRQRALEGELAARRTTAAQAERARARAAALGHYAAGMDLVIRGQLPERAIALLRQALAADPLFPEAAYALGEALQQAGRIAEAGTAYLDADRLSRAELGRPYLQALVAAGIALETAGEFSRAVGSMREAAATPGDDPLALVARTALALRERRLAEADRLSRQAVAAGGHLWEVHYARTTVLRTRRQYGGAATAAMIEEWITHARRACALVPGRQLLQIALASALDQGPDRAQHTEAAAIRARLLDGRSPNPLIRAHWVMTFINEGLLDRAKQALAEARLPGELSLYVQQMIQSQCGDLAGALATLDRLGPADGWAEIETSRLSVEARTVPHPQGFLDRLQAWTREHPETIEGPAIAAIAAMHRGDLAAARAILDQALLRFPDSHDLWLSRAHLALLEKDHARAGEIAVRLIRLMPMSWQTRQLELECLLRLGQHDRLRQRADDLMADFPNDNSRALRASAFEALRQREGR